MSAEPLRDASFYLPHLQRCPRCDDGRISEPLVSSGAKDPKRKGHKYQVCLMLRPGTFDQCPNFVWLPKTGATAPPETQRAADQVIACPSLACQSLSAPRRINQNCTFRLCSACCKAMHQDLHVRPCKVWTHNHAPSDAPRKSPPSRYRCFIALRGLPQARRRGVQTARPQGPQAGGLAASATPSSDNAPVPRGAGSAASSNSRQALALSISPPYVERLIAIEVEERLRHERLARANQAGAAESHRVMVYWHWKNGEKPEIIPVDLDEALWPRFQPTDSPELVARFKVDQERYQYFDWKLYNWVSASSLVGPRNVLTSGELHYRSLGVEYGPNMPGPDGPTVDTPRGSHLSLPPNPPFTPATPSQSVSHSPPSTRESALLSPGPATPSGLPLSSAWNTPSRSTGTTVPPSSALPSAPTPPTSSIGLQPSAGQFGGMAIPSVLPPPTPLPSAGVALPQAPGTARVTSSLPVGVPSIPSASTGPLPSLLATVAMQAAADLSGPAPEGPHGWPLRYFVDMALGFQEMRRLTTQGVGKQAAFEQAFKRPRVHNTFYGNYRAFCAAEKIPGTVENTRDIAFVRKSALAPLVPHPSPLSMEDSHPRTPLTAREFHHLPSDIVRAVLRLWVRKPKTVNLVPDGEPLLHRCIEEKLSIAWDRVVELARDGGSPSNKCPAGVARREWRVDVRLAQGLIKGEFRHPFPQRAPSMSPLTEIEDTEARLAEAELERRLEGPEAPPDMRASTHNEPPPRSPSSVQSAESWSGISDGSRDGDGDRASEAGTLHTPSARALSADSHAFPSPLSASLYADGLDAHLADWRPGARPSPAPTLLDQCVRACGYEELPKGDVWDAPSEWDEAEDTEEFVWEGYVDVHVSGVDYRTSPRAGRRGGGVLQSLPLRYYRAAQYVAVDAEALAAEFVRVVVGLDTDLYISVPDLQDDHNAFQKLAVVTGDGKWQLLTSREIQLRPLDKSSKAPGLRDVHFALDYQLDPVQRERSRVRDVTPREHTPVVKRAFSPSASRSPSRRPVATKRRRAQSDTSPEAVTKRSVVEAVTEWIGQVDDGRFEEMPEVTELRDTKGKKSHDVDCLLRWSKVVKMIGDLEQTDATAGAPGANVKITQEHIGAFVGRGSEWIGQAAHVRRIYEQHRTNPSLQAELKCLRDNHRAVGMKTLLGVLTWSIKPAASRGPHPLQNVLPPAAFAAPAALSSLPETDEFVKAHEDSHPGGCLVGQGLGPRPLDSDRDEDDESDGGSQASYESWPWLS
ncbi:hypothetical protein C8Q76DRAFT_803037 [Earliella scabrosa]|nr:hypothetical protein C8Q76DRAFT_803037 [Earliella scabrosa]